MDGTRCIINALRPDIPFIHASTCSVYGEVGGADILRETATPEPLRVYSKTKLEAEQFVTSMGGINLRFVTLYGPSPRMRLDLLIHDFCKIALTSAKLALYQPAAVRPFLHVEDAAASVLFAMDNWGTMFGKVYNVGSDVSTVSKLEIVRLIGQLVPLDFVLDTTQADPENRQTRVSFERIEACGYGARHSLASGLKGTIEAVRQQLAEKGESP
jgi:nucleoside-diphosphate-sugar epimerase